MMQKNTVCLGRKMSHQLLCIVLYLSTMWMNLVSWIILGDFTQPRLVQSVTNTSAWGLQEIGIKNIPSLRPPAYKPIFSLSLLLLDYHYLIIFGVVEERERKKNQIWHNGRSHIFVAVFFWVHHDIGSEKKHHLVCKKERERTSFNTFFLE